MRITLQKLKTRFHKTSIILLSFMIMTSACKKSDSEIVENPEEPSVVFAYEVECTNCNISYTNEANQTISVKNNSGKWSYQINKKISFELKLKITTLNASYQTIQAYLLKNEEVIFGNMGYNSAEISYNTESAKGTVSFGTYASNSPSTGSGSGGSTAPTSSVCGAKNKTGGYCKRVVSGGGRCWQHR